MNQGILTNRAFRLLAAALLLALALVGAGGGPAFASCGGTTTVSNTTELNDAIDDFNGQAGPCDYEIEFDADITLSDNVALISNTNAGVSLLIDGAGFMLDGDFSFNTFVAGDTEEVTFTDLTIHESSGNSITVYNGDALIERVTILRADSDADGVEMYNGMLVVRDSTVQDVDDDGIDASSADVRIERTSILNNVSDAVEIDGGTLEVVDSTLAFNQDDGIDAYDATTAIFIINSTIARNLDTGLYQYAATSTLTHVTLAGNTIGLEIDEGSATVNNSILDSDETNCRTFGSGAADVNFSLLNSTDDACGVADGVDGNIVGEDAMLLPLGDYGGPTATMPPLELTGSVTLVSPAVDNGSNALSVDETAATLDFDQRGAGFPRELNGTVDMGAVEGPQELVCPTFPAAAANEMELVAAILCYNEITTAGVYTLALNADIDLTASPPAIDNNEAGVSLVIQGNSWMIDGQDTPGVRPMTVAEDTTVTLNEAIITGGNVFGNGGGILNEGDLTINISRIDENAADNDGGGIFNEDDGTLTLNNSTVNSNTALFPDGDGGGIANDGHMTLTDSVVTDNTAEGNFGVWAGGIWNEGVMTITRGSISGNRVEALGDEFEDGYEALGGGIANQANLVIRDSTIANNSATGDFWALGGGIFSAADPEEVVGEGYGTQLLIINSTISSNIVSAQENVYGGGLYATNVFFNCCLGETVPVTLINTTVAANTLNAINDVDFGGGGAFFDSDDSDTDFEVTIHNSILADNTTDSGPGGDCERVTGSELTFESLHSLYEDTSSGACGLAAANPDADGNIVGVDPALGPLAANGGPTLTHLPGALSPAVDAGDNDLADDENGDPLTADQRGYIPRIVNGTVDMGSVEVGAEPPAGPGIFVSTTAAGTTDDAVAFGPHDVLMWEGGTWSKWFDGSAAGLMPSGRAIHNVNSVWIPDTSGDDVVLSFVQNARVVPGVPGKVNGMDLVWWDGSAFSLWFDGEDVGLTVKTKEKIDALHVLPGSLSPIGGGCLHYLLISTQGDGKVPNYSGGQIKFDGTDVLGFCMTNSGANTAGLWHRVLNGKAEGMPGQALTSLSASDDGQTLYLTTKGAFNVDSAAGGHSMVYTYDMGSGTFDGPIFSAPAEGLNRQVDGLHVEGDLP